MRRLRSGPQRGGALTRTLAAGAAKRFAGRLCERFLPAAEGRKMEGGFSISKLVLVSSAGIHALLRERKATTALVCPPGNVMRLFEIVRANRRVPIYEDMNAALESLALVCRA